MKKSFIIMMMFVMQYTISFSKDFTIIIPNNPGSGLTIWATEIILELNKLSTNSYNVEMIPGGKTVTGVNKFVTEEKFKNAIISTGGSTAIEFLINNNVKYHYNDFKPLVINPNVMYFTSTVDFDYTKDKVVWVDSSGRLPDTMIVSYIFSNGNMDNIKYGKGFSTGEARLAHIKGETNIHRDASSAYLKTLSPLVKENKLNVLFSTGIYDKNKGSFIRDYTNIQTWEEYYEKVNGKKPSGEMYDTVKFSLLMRDGLQKALWVDKDNPDYELIMDDIRTVFMTPDSRDRLIQKQGNFPYHIGTDAEEFYSSIMSNLNEKSYLNLIDFSNNNAKIKAFYNDKISRME